MIRIVLLSIVVNCISYRPSLGDDTEEVSFRSDIAPILLESCLACHGPKRAEGGYRVDTYEYLVKPGDSGEQPIIASADHFGELMRRITSDDESERMPADNKALLPQQIELIGKWIAGGAKFDGDNPSQSLALVIPPPQYAPPPRVYQRAIPITAVAFSPDGGQLLTSGHHEIVIWNIADGTLIRRIQNLGQRILALAFSADGQTLAVGCGAPGQSGEVRLCDFSSGEVIGVVARTNDVVLDLAFRPEKNELAVASADSSIRIVDVETLAEVRTIASHADWVTAVAWSDDGTRLASASRDKSVKVYDGDSEELLSSYLGHGAAVRGVSVLAGNKEVVSVGADKKLHRWSIEGAKKITEIGVGGGGYKLVRKGTDIFVPSSDHRLRRVELTSNWVGEVYEGHSDWVLAVCCQPTAASEGEVGHVATGSFDGEICLWNIADATVVRRWIAKP